VAGLSPSCCSSFDLASVPMACTAPSYT
jgi:hypothetical protein